MFTITSNKSKMEMNYKPQEDMKKLHNSKNEDTQIREEKRL